MNPKLFLIECGMAHLDIEREKAEEELAIGRVGLQLAEEELHNCEVGKVVQESICEELEREEEKMKRQLESYRKKGAELRKQIEEIGVCYVDDAAKIDLVESFVKVDKMVCKFYAEDPEIMEEMKRRGLECFPFPAEEEDDAKSGSD